jgi:purine-binding chemotaxis protein CheW
LVAVVVLPVRDDLYAVPIVAVREVVTRPRVRAVPGMPPSVVGLFNLRGEVLPLFDAAVLIGTGRIVDPPYGVVLAMAGGSVGLAVTGPPRAEVLDEAAGPSDAPGTAGAYRLGDDLATLLDVDALLAPEVIGGRSLLTVSR